MLGLGPRNLSRACFSWVVSLIGALQKVYIPYGSHIEALYTLNSPPIVSFHLDSNKRTSKSSSNMWGRGGGRKLSPF